MISTEKTCALLLFGFFSMLSESAAADEHRIFRGMKPDKYKLRLLKKTPALILSENNRYSSKMPVIEPKKEIIYTMREVPVNPGIDYTIVEIKPNRALPGIDRKSGKIAPKFFAPLKKQMRKLILPKKIPKNLKQFRPKKPAVPLPGNP